MRRNRLVASTVAATAVALAICASYAPAGSPGSWTRLPGTVINFAEPGVARTSDGVLHTVYVVKNGTKSDMLQASVKPAGSVGSGPSVVTGWSALAHPDLLLMPDGSLRAFFGGIRSTATGEGNNALNTATAPAGGGPWTLQAGHAAQATYAYATTVTGAGLAKDGTPISTWSGTPGLGFHYGTDPADPDGKIPQSGCCLYEPEIAVDSATGQAYVGFYSNESATPGLFVNRIGPGGPQGGRIPAPGALQGKSILDPAGRTAVTGRIGAAGVFLAYGRGYPTYKTIAVWRVTAAKPQLVIPASGARHVNVAAAPEGRLWLVWERSGSIYATRTNKAATRVGPATALKPPAGGSVYRLNAEGSAGPLDLIANVGGGGQSLWHQQVLPRLQIVSKSAKAASGRRTIEVRVLDAGDPVAGAKVVVAGKSGATGAKGSVVFSAGSSAKVKAAASKPGYAPATASV
jgi:hypothetical protein